MWRRHLETLSETNLWACACYTRRLIRITDNHRKDSYKTFSSFWANSQCKKIFIHSFLCWFDKIYVKDNCWSNWDFKLMAGDWENEKLTFLGVWIILTVLPLAFAQPNYWSWQVTPTGFKNHPVVRIRISDLKL